MARRHPPIDRPDPRQRRRASRRRARYGILSGRRLGWSRPADLESLITFREHQIRFNRTLADEFSAMRSHWGGLGGVWTDAKYDEFGQALDEVSRGIDRYLAATDGHEAHLLRLIEAIKSFLDTRGY